MSRIHCFPCVRKILQWIGSSDFNINICTTSPVRQVVHFIWNHTCIPVPCKVLTPPPHSAPKKTQKQNPIKQKNLTTLHCKVCKTHDPTFIYNGKYIYAYKVYLTMHYHRWPPDLSNQCSSWFWQIPLNWFSLLVTCLVFLLSFQRSRWRHLIAEIGIGLFLWRNNMNSSFHSL